MEKTGKYNKQKKPSMLKQSRRTRRKTKCHFLWALQKIIRKKITSRKKKTLRKKPFSRKKLIPVKKSHIERKCKCSQFVVDSGCIYHMANNDELLSDELLSSEK